MGYLRLVNSVVASLQFVSRQALLFQVLVELRLLLPLLLFAGAAAVAETRSPAQDANRLRLIEVERLDHAEHYNGSVL